MPVQRRSDALVGLGAADDQASHLQSLRGRPRARCPRTSRRSPCPRPGLTLLRMLPDDLPAFAAWGASSFSESCTQTTGTTFAVPCNERRDVVYDAIAVVGARQHHVLRVDDDHRGVRASSESGHVADCFVLRPFEHTPFDGTSWQGYSCMVQASKDRSGTPDQVAAPALTAGRSAGLRDVTMIARRKAAGSAHDKSVVMPPSHLMTFGPLRASDPPQPVSTVSRHLSALEADGYVTRTPDPDDGGAPAQHHPVRGEVVRPGARATPSPRRRRHSTAGRTPTAENSSASPAVRRMHLEAPVTNACR